MPAPRPVQTTLPTVTLNRLHSHQRQRSQSTSRWNVIPRRYHLCAMAAAANRGWREASRQSLQEQRHLMSSVVSFYALNPLLLPAILLAWLLQLSALLTRYPIVRTSLYLMAVLWSHTVIYAIRAVTPICFLYAAYSLIYHAVHILDSTFSLPYVTGFSAHLALLFSFVEIYFYLHTHRRSVRLQARIAGPEFSNARRWLVFRRVEEAAKHVLPMKMPKNCVYWRKFKALRSSDAQDHQQEGNWHTRNSSDNTINTDISLTDAQAQQHPLEWMRGWFFNLPLKHIKHDNLMTFFAEMTFNAGLSEISPQQREEIEEVVQYIQLKASRLTTKKQLKAKHIGKLKEAHEKLMRRRMNMSGAAASGIEIVQQHAHSENATPPPTILIQSDRSTSPSSSSSPRSSTSPDSVTSSDSSSSSSPEAIVSSPCVTSMTRRNGRSTNDWPSDSSSSSARSSGSPTSSRDADEDSDDNEEEEDDWDTHLTLGTLPAGHNIDHDPMKLNQAPITYLHRPLAIYLGVSGLGLVAAVYMRYLGFTHHRAGVLSYWYRRAVLTPEEVASNHPRADPLVMIHGIGIGPFTYLHMLSQLYQTRHAASCQQRSMYIIELPYISMRLGEDEIPSPQAHVASIAEMLYHHETAERALYKTKCGGTSAYAFFATPTPSLDEIQQSSQPIKAMFVAHSFGTFVLSWVVKHRSDLVASSVFIDPVCFLVFDPTLIYNFIYRTPFSLVTSIYHFFTAKELGISYALCRHFFWYENVLFREEFERIGMSARELEASLIAEREQCVASLPYQDFAEIEKIIISQEDETKTTKLVQEEANKDVHTNERARSDGETVTSSYADVAASSAPLHEHPLCPSHSLGRRVHIFLASHDDITPVPSIVAYLAECHSIEERKWGRGESMFSYKVFNGVGHAEALFHKKMRSEIIDTIQSQPSHAEMCRQTQTKSSRR